MCARLLHASRGRYNGRSVELIGEYISSGNDIIKPQVEYILEFLDDGTTILIDGNDENFSGWIISNEDI